MKDFKPFYTPKEMLEMGVFEGVYLNSTKDEYPASWFKNAKLSDRPDISVNYFGVKSRQPLSVWKEKGWINDQDPHGWFQWYCRYSMGRRSPDDARQIARWASFARHAGQVKLRGNEDPEARLAQRQALLQWSHYPFPDFKVPPVELTPEQKEKLVPKEDGNKYLTKLSSIYISFLV